MPPLLIITADRRGSRRSEIDAVPEMLADLSDVTPTVLPFMRTVGDELQGVLDATSAVTAGALFTALDHLGAGEDWWIGIGIGPGRLGADATSSAGPAFYAARAAVELAKAGDLTGAVAIRVGVPEDQAELRNAFDHASRVELQDALPYVAALGPRAVDQWSAYEMARVALGRHLELLRGRSPEGRAAIALARLGHTREQIGRELGVTRQAVDKRLAAAGWPRAEHESRHLLGLAVLRLATALEPA
ncbi:MAG: hypothetical protein J7513_08565 [Solirubrobacteraceae bacterium]|nr:hypothetical protein [Solirubrobacteraceae bacterium]